MGHHPEVDAAYLLSNVIPRLVPVEINPAASRGTLQGGLIDLLERMRAAFPPEVQISKAEWLEARNNSAARAAEVGGGGSEASDEKMRSAKDQHQAAAAASALVPREVPSLPKGNMPRRAILNGIKKALFRDRDAGSSSAGLREGATLLVQGMGGSGKTAACRRIDRVTGLRCVSLNTTRNDVRKPLEAVNTYKN